MNDLISRAEALKAMHKMWQHIVAVARRNHPTEGEKAVYLDMQNTIKALPSEQRTGKWKKIPSNWGSAFARSECGEKTVETVMEYIKTLSRIDVEEAHAVPVKHGKWYELATYDGCEVDLRCGNCGATVSGFVQDYKFCPYCGARMDEDNVE